MNLILIHPLKCPRLESVNKVLRDLRRLSTAGLTSDDAKEILCDHVDDLVFEFMYGQLLPFPLDFILGLLLGLDQHLRYVCELLIFIR